MKIILIQINIFLFTLTALPVLSSGTDNPNRYGYVKKDTVAEQKSFIKRLEEDKKKVNLAIKNTKGLIEKSRNRPYLPELYLRLAELYIEKSRIVYFIRNKQANKSIKSLEHLESNSLKNKAIEIYRRIINNFPDFKEKDKAHFFMAHEYRELGKMSEMIKQYKAIIKDYKDSEYAAEAYLLLGDYFFNTNDIEMAHTQYESVFNYPQSSALAIARYKLGWIYINKLDFKKAIKLFEESVTTVSSSNSSDIDTYERVDVKVESLIDMTFSYSEVYKDSTPYESIAYFKKYSWSRPVFIIVLEKMAYRYFIKKKWNHAAVLYRHLSILQQDAEKLLEYVRNIFECERELKTFEDADKDMAIIIRALEQQRHSVHIAEEEKKEHMIEYELYARDIVTRLHEKAREEVSLVSFKRASGAYKIYLDFFDGSPAFKEMESNYAEALFSAKEYLEAGKYYERLSSKMASYTNQREEKLYSAVVSYYNALKEKESMNYYQAVFAREGLKTAGKIFIDEFPGSKRVPLVQFNVAWIVYDTGNYDEAINRFTAFVEQYPASREAKAAVHLILDSYNLKEDYEGLTTYGNTVISNNKINDAPFKKEVFHIVRAAESKIISSFTIAAVNDWDKGKAELIGFAEGNKSSRLGGQALYALLAPSLEKGDFKNLLNTGNEIITKYPDFSRTEDTLSILIDFSFKTAQFRLLAQYLETFAERLPQHKNSAGFLYQAGAIRENLGEYEQANKNYQLFFDRSQTEQNDKQAEVIFALADNAEKMGNPDWGNKFLIEKTKYLSNIDQVKANARIAGYFYTKEKVKSAQPYRKKAKKGYQPSLVEKDAAITPLMARMEFNALQEMHKKYMDIRLKDTIDNKMVKEKGVLLQELEKGYLAVIQYRSPRWALKACSHLYKVNAEFARFLNESPLPPDLSPDQQKQYRNIIKKKAEDFSKKATQYLEASINQAHKWEISDPILMKYYTNSTGLQQVGGVFDYFSKPAKMVGISEQFLKDETLKSLHTKLFQEPEDSNTLAALSLAYAKKSDFRQAILLGQKALDETKDQNDPIKALIYNTLGVCYEYTNDDEVARDAFKKALSIDPEHVGARVNLAALYQHYDHTAKADNIYKTLPAFGEVERVDDLIHLRAREMYRTYMN